MVLTRLFGGVHELPYLKHLNRVWQTVTTLYLLNMMFCCPFIVFLYLPPSIFCQELMFFPACVPVIHCTYSHSIVAQTSVGFSESRCVVFIFLSLIETGH